MYLRNIKSFVLFRRTIFVQSGLLKNKRILIVIVIVSERGKCIQRSKDVVVC